jgi:GNAT superfamily N-acetyltransferase
VSGDRAPLPRRAIEVLREEGIRSFWWRSLGITFYRRLVLVAREIDDGPLSAARQQLSFDFLEPGHLDDYLRLRPDLPATEVERRLETRQRCLLTRQEGQVVSARWVATGRAEMPYLDHAFDLPEEVAYVYDVYTSRAARGLGIGAEGGAFAVGLLRSEGYRRLLGTFMPQNTAGLRLVTAAGYRAVGRIGCFRLPGLRLLVPRIPPGYLGPPRRLRI